MECCYWTGVPNKPKKWWEEAGLPELCRVRERGFFWDRWEAVVSSAEWRKGQEYAVGAQRGLPWWWPWQGQWLTSAETNWVFVQLAGDEWKVEGLGLNCSLACSGEHSSTHQAWSLLSLIFTMGRKREMKGSGFCISLCGYSYVWDVNELNLKPVSWWSTIRSLCASSCHSWFGSSSLFCQMEGKTCLCWGKGV